MGPQTFGGQANVKGILPAVCEVGSYSEYDEVERSGYPQEHNKQKQIPGKNWILTLLLIPVKYCAFRTMFMYVKTIQSGHDVWWVINKSG